MIYTWPLSGFATPSSLSASHGCLCFGSWYYPPSASPAWVTAAPCAGLDVHFFCSLNGKLFKSESGSKATSRDPQPAHPEEPGPKTSWGQQGPRVATASSRLGAAATTACGLVINTEQLVEPLPSQSPGFIHIALPYQPCFSQALKFRRKRKK